MHWLQSQAAAAARGRLRSVCRRGRSRSRPGGASSRRLPRTGRRCSWSRICTGPTRRCSTFLAYLAEWAEGVPLLLLCTARPELYRDALDLGSRDAERAHDQPVAALGRRDGASSCRACSSRPCSEQVQRGDPRAGGRQPALCGGVRPPGRGSWTWPTTGRGVAVPGERAGADRGPPGHAAAGAERPAAGRGRRRQGVLGRRPRRDGRAATSARSSSRCTSSSRKELVRPARRARWRARPSTRSGTCSSATSPTARSRGPPARASIGPRRRGSSAKAGERVEDLADVLAYHYQEALELARAAGDADGGRASARRAAHARPRRRPGARRSTRRRPTASTAGRSPFTRTPTRSRRRCCSRRVAQLSTLSATQAEQDAGRAVDLYRLGDELGAAEALLDLTRYAAYRAETPRPVSTLSMRSGWSSVIRPGACPCSCSRDRPGAT